MTQPPQWAQRALKNKKATGKKPPWRPRCAHCFLWQATESENIVIIKCAHCTEVRARLNLALLSQEKLRSMCDETRRAHARLCRHGAR